MRWSSARLIGSVEAVDGFGDFGVDVRDCFLHALAEIARFVAVAQLDGFVFAGGGAGRDRGAADDAAFEANVRLDGGIAARIENLAAMNGDNFGGHSSLRENRVIIARVCSQKPLGVSSIESLYRERG